jgi:predicted AlkP superfamily pyrophosphatase or phosphodiesterase
MRNILWVGLVLLLGSVASVAAEDVAPRKKVLFIGIDGCRYDALRAANTPHIDRLVEHGTLFEGTDILSPQRTDHANTVSGPGWSNLLTGVWPNKHLVANNKFIGPNYKRYPHFFVRAKESRPQLKTASYSDWGPIAKQILAGADVAVDRAAEGSDEYRKHDAELAAECAKLVQTGDPDLVFLYLGQVDEHGHKHGFHPTVKPYTEAIERVDAHIGQVITAIAARPTKAQEDWLVLVGTDHGGAGTDHAGGHENPDIRRTFFIASGPSTVRGVSQEATYQVDHVATALTHLGIAIDPIWELDGQARGLKQP